MYRGLEPHQLMPMTGVPSRLTQLAAAVVRLPLVSRLDVRYKE